MHHHLNRVRFLWTPGAVKIRLTAAVCAFWLYGLVAVAAQEVCVVCTAPAAVYRCTVEKAEKLGRLGAIGDKAMQTVCIKELARQSGHATCAVRRDSGPAICEGPERQITIESLLDAPPTAKAEPASAPPAPVAIAPPPAPLKPADPKDGPPKTMQELAQRTGESSKKQLKAVGDDVGDAVAKTWNCLTSLFKNC
jgi:hypothetical protein